MEAGGMRMRVTPSLRHRTEENLAAAGAAEVNSHNGRVVPDAICQYFLSVGGAGRSTALIV